MQTEVRFSVSRQRFGSNELRRSVIETCRRSQLLPDLERRCFCCENANVMNH